MDTGAEEDEGLLAQAEDDDNASGYFYRRKACLLLLTDGSISRYRDMPSGNMQPCSAAEKRRENLLILQCIL